MFTGIIQAVGTVHALRAGGAARVLTIALGPLAEQVAVGDSVAIDGVCLTATAVRAPNAEFDVSAETLRLTTLSRLREGSLVNLEPALRVGDRLGGHFVQGHVDGVGTVQRFEELPGEARLGVQVAPALSEQIILKGSIAVDGISLTVAELREGYFEVSVIPHTRQATTLRHLRAGDAVNIECDVIGRYVRSLVGRATGPGEEALTLNRLEEQGF